MSWYLSKYYLLALFFPLTMQLPTIYHRLWSQLFECLLNVTQVFRQVVSLCCGDIYCVLSVCGSNVKVHDYAQYTQMCKELYCNLYLCMGACVHTSEHKFYPERDKSNPLPGRAQGSTIDGTLRGCWWTSLSDKVYHSDLSQTKSLSGISRCRGKLKAKIFT